jgi:eukaryotic-like serine/threonine-protein kinase
MGASSADDTAERALATTHQSDGGDAGESGSALPPPEVVRGDRYLLLDQIGEGGMGVVWAAYDRVLDRKVALKLLNDAYLGAANQARLAREAKVMARLSHPNVVPVYDVGEREGRMFLTMELVTGRSLAEWLKETRSWREIVDVFRAAARGLVAAHEAGIVHRDVKPGNILVGEDGRTRVADFGVSRADAAESSAVAAVEGASTSTVETAGLAGSPAYMAPEQLRGERVDARCDQFGLCVALHEALTGARPFVGDSIPAMLAAIAKGPSPLGGEAPEWLARIVTRGLAHEPDARFASMGELADALDGPRPSRLRRNLVIGAVVVGSVAAAAITSMMLRPAPARGVAPPDCAGEAATAASESWNPARRDALVAAFARAAVPGAVEEAQRVATAIDAHVAAWRAQAETSCRAARIDHTWPDDVGVLSQACLATQRTAFSALFDALTRADDAAVSSGFELVSRLEPASACGDPDLLRGQVAPPRDPARAAAIDALERRADAIRVAMTLRRTDEVKRDLPTFLADASKSGDARIETEAVLLGSKMARAEDDLDGAAREGKRAYLLARRHRDVVLAAEAAADLVWILGYFKGDAVAGQDWADLALVELESIPHAKVAVHVHQAVGVFAESRGQGPASIDHQRRALELVRRYYGPDHFTTAKSIELVASALGEAGKPDEAAALYRESMPLIAKAFGETSHAYANLLSHYAIVLKNAGDDATAIQIAEKSREVGRAAGIEGSELGSLILNHGAVLQEAGRVDEAIAQFEQARALFVAAGKQGEAADVLVNMGGIHVDQLARGGDAALERKAIAELEEATRMLEAAWGPTDRSVALASSSLSRLHAMRGRCARAIPLAERAIAIYEQSPGLPDIADPLLVIGRCRLDAGKVTEAVAVLDRASKAQHAGGNDPVIAAEIDKWLDKARQSVPASTIPPGQTPPE